MSRVFLLDLRYASRALRKNLTFATTAIVTLALGIAAVTVIFSVVDAVLLSPLEYRDPDRIYRLRTIDEQGLPRGTVGRVLVDPLADDSETVEAAVYGYSLESSIVNREGTAFAINEYRVSEEFFQVFTDPLTLGRAFQPGDDFDRTVLSHQTWRDVFASDPNIVGAPILVNGAELNVIGVAGEGFEYPVGAALWTKIYTGPGTQGLFNMDGYLRARPGVTGEQVQAELDVLAGRLPLRRDDRPMQFVARPLITDVVGDLKSTLLIVSGATAILLLIACLNVANLLFTRGVARTGEIAIREALGAERWRVFRQLMTESLVLCGLGGVLGLGLAMIAIRVLRALAPADLPRLDTVAIDPSIVVVAAACVLFTAVVAGVAPALRLSFRDLSGLINQSGRSNAVGPGRSRTFGALVVAEIALAVLLVIGAGLLVRSYSELTSTDPGFDPGRMLTLVLNVPGRLDPSGVTFDDEGNVTSYDRTTYVPVLRFYQELMDRIEAVPGVASAGATSAAPLNAGLFPVTLTAYLLVGDSDGDAEVDQSNVPMAYGNQVSPGFFTALGVRPALGRLLEDSDRRSTQGVAVINQTFARTYFDGGDPVGRRIDLPGAGNWAVGGLAFQLGERAVDQVEIVGVIPDIKQANLAEPVQPAIYIPQEQWTMRRMALVVRSEIDGPASLIPGIRDVLAGMDSTIPAQFSVYSDVIAASVARQKLGAILLVVFGAVSLTLAAVGIYGLVSYSVSQRTNEIAVRSAIGADRRRVLKMFLMRALRLAVIGVVLGVGGAMAMRRIVSSQLYEVSAVDPLVFVIVPLTMLGVALLASYMPARRASSVDFSAALREN
jgi:predicted permease